MTGVTRWTGREAGLLRKAMRKPGKAFAELVGVNPRQIPRWEGRGETLELSLTNQAALDTVLSEAPATYNNGSQRSSPSGPPSRTTSAQRNCCAATPARALRPVDGMLMTLVEEGIYLSGADNRSVWLDSFLIDIYPTTNEDYEKFVRLTRHRPPQHWPSGRCPTDLSHHPVVWVTWLDVNAYARWSGKALPTARQWEKAARGTKGRIYPWGNEPTAAKANISETGMDDTTPVSRYQSGASPYGVFDMCGNTWEWCSTEETPVAAGMS